MDRKRACERAAFPRMYKKRVLSPLLLLSFSSSENHHSSQKYTEKDLTDLMKRASEIHQQFELIEDPRSTFPNSYFSSLLMRELFVKVW